MKYKTKYVYSKEHLQEEVKECKKLGLTILVSKKVKTGLNKSAYEITTKEYRED